MDQGIQVILWAAGLLIVFVLLTLLELWFVKRMGFDIIAHLQVTKTRGRMPQFFIEAFGVVAFVLAQPIVFAWLFSRISASVREVLLQSLQSLIGAP
jgi:hypothetical protein